MRSRMNSFLALAFLALASMPACKPADAATVLKSSPTPASAASGGGFGSDVLVNLANSAAADKTVSEWISSYGVSTAGSEQSIVEIKVLDGSGAQGTGIKINGQSNLEVPLQVRFSLDNDTGIDRSAPNTIAFVSGGSQYAFVNSGGVVLNGSVGSQLSWAGTTAGVAYSSATGNVSVTCASGNGNVNLGGVTGAALAANATTKGLVTFPTVSGTPTGVPTVTAGQAACIVDTTNNKFQCYYDGAWHSLSP